VPRHPVTKANIAVARSEEGKLDVIKLIEEAINKTEVIDL